MLNKEQKKLLNSKNKLQRYKLIKELYHKSIQEHPYTPLSKILAIYIYPVYPISRVTLYQVLCTSISIELKKIEELEKYLQIQKKKA